MKKDRYIYWISNPDGHIFYFTSKRDAEKALKYLEEKYPDEGLSIYREDVWTSEDIYHIVKGDYYYRK